jgi:hypothetical protein
VSPFPLLCVHPSRSFPSPASPASVRPLEAIAQASCGATSWTTSLRARISYRVALHECMCARTHACTTGTHTHTLIHSPGLTQSQPPLAHPAHSRSHRNTASHLRSPTNPELTPCGLRHKEADDTNHGNAASNRKTDGGRRDASATFTTRAFASG